MDGYGRRLVDESARVDEHEGREQQTAGRDHEGGGPPSAVRQGDQNRTCGENAPLLVGDGQADEDPAERGAVALRTEHGGDAQDASKQFFGMAALQSEDRERVEATDDGCGQPGHDPMATPFHFSVQPQQQCPHRRQARQRSEAVHRNLAPPVEAADRHERSAQQQRSAVRRSELEEGGEVSGE